MPTVDINYWAVLVATAVAFVIGGLWYSPLLFGNKWTELMNFSQKDISKMKTKARKSYAIHFVATFVMVYVLSHFVGYAGAATVAGGLQAGFWVWLGFVATIQLGSVLWESKPWQLYFINVSYHLVMLLITGVILAVWL